MNFSPDGKHLATGSGDTCVRFWNLSTQCAKHTCKGHKNWVLVVAWSPDAQCVASGDMNGMIWLWDPVSGSDKGTLKGHTKWITSMVLLPVILLGGGFSPLLKSISPSQSCKSSGCLPPCLPRLSPRLSSLLTTLCLGRKLAAQPHRSLNPGMGTGHGLLACSTDGLGLKRRICPCLGCRHQVRFA